MSSGDRHSVAALLCVSGTWLLLVAGLVLFAHGVDDARRAAEAWIRFYQGNLSLQDDPRTYSWTVLLGFAVAASLVSGCAGLATFYGCPRLGVRLAGTAAAILVMLIVAGFISHSLLFPCIDESTLYNCNSIVGHDGIALASALFIAAMMLCLALAMWVSSREGYAPYSSDMSWSGPRY